jgi:formylglycine-generating enzyme required for sulfatase activity
VSFRRDYDAGLSQLARVLGLSLAPPPVEMPQRVAAPQAVSPAIAEPRRPLEPELVLIPAGDFLMGSHRDDKKGQGEERPLHMLYLPDYYIAKTPVTNVQYAAFVEAADHKPPEHWKGKKPPQGREDHPVVNVSWYDAIAYCKWLAETTGKAYRLPSEAEWEKAARGGVYLDGDATARVLNPKPARIYPWGNEWGAGRCNTTEGGKGETTPVDRYPQGASPYGLVDMAGNVWEWTTSLWGEGLGKPKFKYPYEPDERRENLYAGNEVYRVTRGGAWGVRRIDARCACRGRNNPDAQWHGLGFRLVVSPISPPSAR